MTLKEKEPIYWGSWKGRVIEAISIYRAQTWEELRDITGLSPKSLNKVLSELFDAEAITKGSDGRYWARKDIYDTYVKHSDQLKAQKDDIPVRISEEEQKHLVTRIDEWKQFKELDFSLKPEHFFLKGSDLYDLSMDLIQRARKEILIANPYVEQCDLSDKLRDAAALKKNVILVTRRPDDKNDEYRKRKEVYHDTLTKSGLRLTYNGRVHAKLIVLDRSVAIVSSMNLNTSSTAGSSWEGGIVSKEESVVEDIRDSILALREKPDSESK